MIEITRDSYQTWQLKIPELDGGKITETSTNQMVEFPATFLTGPAVPLCTRATHPWAARDVHHQLTACPQLFKLHQWIDLR